MSSSSNFDYKTSAEIEKGMYISKLLMPDFVQTMGNWFNLIIIALGWLSFTAEVFFRHSFGERYLSWVRFYFSVGVLVPFLIIPGVFARGSLFLFFWLACFAFFIAHRVVIFRRNTKAEQWHSMSFGISWLEPLLPRLLQNTPVYPWVRQHIDDWSLYRWVEPIIALLLSRVLGIIDGGLGFYLFFAGIGMIVNHNLVYYRQRSFYLDVLDAQIAEENRIGAYNGKPKQQTAGFTVVPMPAVVQAFLEHRSTEVAIAATVQETVSQPINGLSDTDPSVDPAIASVVADTLGNNSTLTNGDGAAHKTSTITTQPLNNNGASSATTTIAPVRSGSDPTA